MALPAVVMVALSSRVGLTTPNQHKLLAEASPPKYHNLRSSHFPSPPQAKTGSIGSIQPECHSDHDVLPLELTVSVTLVGWRQQQNHVTTF